MFGGSCLVSVQKSQKNNDDSQINEHYYFSSKIVKLLHYFITFCLDFIDLINGFTDIK